MRSFLHLQEQVHATQMAVERSRLDAESVSARNTEALNARLRIIENALAQANQHGRSAVEEASRQISESNRRMMILAGVFATLGFLAVAATAWLQWRTASRLAFQTSAVGLPALMSGAGYLPLGLAAGAGSAANARLRDALGRLEHRIADLELGQHAVRTTADTAAAGGGGLNALPAPATSDVASATNVALASLIKEGEELLAHEEAEKAMAHFEAILARHPGHPEVLLHKGVALERLQRDPEALECYDLALRADPNLTMAYLHKGGLYNRLERFSEAMECYEKALKLQEERAGRA
jgi:tetratricopeptide (TPR) repeat protein